MDIATFTTLYMATNMSSSHQKKNDETKTETKQRDEPINYENIDDLGAVLIAVVITLLLVGPFLYYIHKSCD